MRICYVSGNAPRIFKLMTDMVNRGHEVYWIALSPPKHYTEGVKVYESLVIKKEPFLKKLLFTILLYSNFRKLVKNINPDIIHAINVRKAGWLAVLSKFKPVVVSPQGGDVMVKDRHYSHLPVFKRWLKKSFIDEWLRVYTLKNASVITYGNATMLKAIQEWTTIQKSFMYFQGVDLNKIKKEQDLDKLKEQMGVKETKVVFSPRMFNSNSNIDTIIRSIPLVIKAYPDIKFIFVCHLGVDSYFSKLKLLVSELKVDNYCLFLNEIKGSQMYDYYSISDVVISILSSDGMPATVLEALAMRKPQVLSEIPIYMDVFSEFVSIAKLKDVESTANSIVSSLAGGDQLSKKLDEGFDWVLKHANQELLNDGLVELYTKEIA